MGSKEPLMWIRLVSDSHVPKINVRPQMVPTTLK